MNVVRSILWAMVLFYPVVPSLAKTYWIEPQYGHFDVPAQVFTVIMTPYFLLIILTGYLSNRLGTILAFSMLFTIQLLVLVLMLGDSPFMLYMDTAASTILGLLHNTKTPPDTVEHLDITLITFFMFVMLLLLFGYVLNRGIAGLYLEKPPERANKLISKGFALTERQEYEEAYQYFKKALDLEPHNALAFYNIACYHAVKGNIDESVRFLTRSITLMPELAVDIDKDWSLDNVIGDERVQVLLRNATAV